MPEPTTTDANAASYVERCGLILELQGILGNQSFVWIHRAKASSGKTVNELINELIDRQPPATTDELWSMLDRVVAYHFQNVERRS